jgi:hypothetical protein
MSTLLAKILHPVSTATGRDPDGRTGAPRIWKAGKPRRRMLAVLVMPPVVTALSLLGASAASASDLPSYTGNGPTVSSGGISYTGHWSASVSCDAAGRTMTITASNAPAWEGENVYLQEWLYSYQTRQWSHVTYEQDGSHVNPGLQLTLGPTSEPAGWYTVEMVYGWLTPTGWQTVPVVIKIYQQYGAAWQTNGSLSDNYCYA